MGITYFTTRRWYWCIFAIIVFIAAFLRLYRLAEVPAGMTWDEAAIGYNGYAIWETRRDEWVRFLPISFQSFGDYKAPFAIYVNGFFTLIFGMTLWAVRLPFALSGIFAIAGLGLLVRTLWKFNPNKETYFSEEAASIWAMMIMTLSPWHLHFSRIGFESGIALSELIWATYFLLQYFMNPQRKFLNKVSLSLAVLGFGATFYTYHSAKIVTPLLVISWAYFFRERIRQDLKTFIAAGVGGSLLLLPLLKDTLFGSGGERFEQASIFGHGLSFIGLATTLLQNFLVHFSPQFLIYGSTDTLRHGAGAWSVLLPTTLILLTAGGITILFNKKSGKLFSLSYLTILWLIIGILPAAIGRDVPHSNRALLAIPGFILLATLGMDRILTFIRDTTWNKQVVGNHGEKNVLPTLFLGYLLLLHAFFFFQYTRHYYTVFAKESAPAFQEGYLEMLAYVVPYEKGTEGKMEIDKIRISDEYGQPYIYTLFFKKTNPIWYQGGSLIKYDFANVEIGDLLRKNTIVVGTARDKDDLPFERADKLIYGSDGSVRFAIFITKP